MIEDEKLEATIRSEGNTCGGVNKGFCKYSLISEIVVLMGFIAGYSWITVEIYSIVGWAAVVGIQTSFNSWQITLLSVFSLIGLINSSLYIFIVFPKPKRVFALRGMSFAICSVGIGMVLSRVLQLAFPPFNIGSLIALLLPVISTVSVFIVKPLRKIIDTRKDSTAQ
ncbi:MAG: hypothetical protein ACTSQ4_00285 [Candidatus Heimdallarchaeaceae archaeon]